MLTRINKTMPSRMNYNAISYRLISYIANSKKNYRKCSELTDEDFFMIIIYAVAYIEECELNHEKCTMDDIRDFMDTVCKTYNVSINIDELTKDIMTCCFQNSGITYTFNSNMLEKQMDIKMLESENDPVTHKMSYKLTPQFRKWLYASYEMEVIGQITMGALILQKQIETGNFEKAKDTANKLLLDINKRISELQKLERNIISDVDKFSIDEINTTLNEPYETSKETDEKLKYLEGVISEVLNGKFDQLKVEKGYILDCVSTVKNLQEKIKKIIIQNQSLLGQVNKIRNTMQEQLLNSDFLLPKKYINFEKEILETMRTNPNIEFDVFELLSPLFSIKRITHTNPNNLIKKQTLMLSTEEESIDIDVDDEVVTELEEEQNLAHKIYIKIIENIFMHFKSTNIIHLSDIVDKIPYDNNLSALKMVITMLITKGYIKFTKTPQNQKIINIFNLEDIWQFSEEMQLLLNNRIISISFDEQKQISICGNVDNSKREKLILNDMIFTLIQEEHNNER